MAVQDNRTNRTNRIWRTRDIVVAAVIGVAFGVAFWAFGVAWAALVSIEPFQNLLYGIWLMPAIVAPLIIRKPGAALFAELVAAALSMLLGGIWGPDLLLSGFVQGAAAELVFALGRYRTWSFPILAAASLAAATAAWLHDWIVYFATLSFETVLFIGVLMAISAVVILPAASLWLVGSLRRAGVLGGFPG